MDDIDKKIRNRQNLIRLRDKELSRLASFAPKAKEKDAEETLSTIRTLCEQLEGIPAPPGKYTADWSPTDVFKDYLTRVGQAVKVSDLIREIAETERYRGGDEDARTSLKKALGRFAKSSGAVWIKDPVWADVEKELLISGGWVLLKGWDESYIREDAPEQSQ